MDEVCQDILLLYNISRERRAKRFTSGALSLNTMKLHFRLGVEGNPEGFTSYPIRDSNRLVEEYMLLANYLVAQQLLMHCGDQALLRCHPPPPPEGLKRLKETMAHHGMEMRTGSSGSIQASLQRLRDTSNDQLLIQAVTTMATVPMQTAEYIAAGSKKRAEWRHYALNIPYYTHFTSPIRRYADILVHRLLTASLQG
ncbi:unnamed protein product, partial [Discosporangium mesarthrocarpum]